MAVGSKVLATEYNGMQSNVAQVLGLGSSNYGYGQLVKSSQVALTSKISVAQWNDLRDDLLKARQHQTGTDLTSTLPVVSSSDKVSEANRSAYKTVADALYLDANRLITPPATEATRENVVANQTATNWKTLLTQTITLTFSAGNNAKYSWTAADAARFYFNAGGQFEFSASLVGPFSAGSNLKSTTWQTMFTQMGTIAFKYNSTTVSGTGTAAASIGFYQLTTADQLIFTKLAPSGAYSANKYYIYARKSADGSQVIFTIQFRDDSAQPNPPWGTDELVTGTLTSIVQTYRPTGSNVTLPLPTATGPLSGS